MGKSDEQLIFICNLAQNVLVVGLRRKRQDAWLREFKLLIKIFLPIYQGLIIGAGTFSYKK